MIGLERAQRIDHYRPRPQRKDSSISSINYPDSVEYLHSVEILGLFMLDEHHSSKRAHAQRLDAIKVVYRCRVLCTEHHR